MGGGGVMGKSKERQEERRKKKKKTEGKCRKKKNKRRDGELEGHKEWLLVAAKGELIGCCHATDGLWEFCCAMMTVGLGRERTTGI